MVTVTISVEVKHPPATGVTSAVTPISTPTGAKSPAYAPTSVGVRLERVAPVKSSVMPAMAIPAPSQGVPVCKFRLGVAFEGSIKSGLPPKLLAS